MDAPHVRLAALRAHHGLSPRAFGERLATPPKKISDQMIRFIEANKRSAGRDLVLSIEAFSRTPNAAGVVWPGAPLLASEWFGHHALEATTEPTDSTTTDDISVDPAA